MVEQLEDDMNGATNVDESAALVDAIVAIPLQRLSISTASTADALAIETAATNLPGIDPPLVQPPHLGPTLLVNNNNNPPLEVDNDFNGANDVDPFAFDPLADAPVVLGAEGRKMDAANLSQALVESRARDYRGDLVSALMFSILCPMHCSAFH